MPHPQQPRDYFPQSVAEWIPAVPHSQRKLVHAIHFVQQADVSVLRDLHRVDERQHLAMA